MGNGLDFGCGNGVFTKVLKTALPGWNIYGCDLSDVAIENAKKIIKIAHFSLIPITLN
ncbi:Methyltransferase type 12 domain protein [Candidatus Magnetoovum chiemensis]|nr:Methyltransferase type 12 domain protein [Candidatus Magnetoovum chiemensis]